MQNTPQIKIFGTISKRASNAVICDYCTFFAERLDAFAGIDALALVLVCPQFLARKTHQLGFVGRRMPWGHGLVGAIVTDNIPALEQQGSKVARQQGSKAAHRQGCW